MQNAVDDAVAFQRALHVQEEDEAQKAIDAEGGVTASLTAAEHEAFFAAVQPLLHEARQTYGDALLGLMKG